MHQYIKMLLFHIYMKLNMFRATHRPYQESKTALAASEFFIRRRLLDVSLVDVVLTTSTNDTSNILLRMINQRLPVQF